MSEPAPSSKRRKTNTAAAAAAADKASASPDANNGHHSSENKVFLLGAATSIISESPAPVPLPPKPKRKNRPSPTSEDTAADADGYSDEQLAALKDLDEANFQHSSLVYEAAQQANLVLTLQQQLQDTMAKHQQLQLEATAYYYSVVKPKEQAVLDSGVEELPAEDQEWIDWLHHYEALASFARDNGGSIALPANRPEYDELAAWLAAQQALKAGSTSSSSNQKTKLTERQAYQVELLEKLGVVWMDGSNNEALAAVVGQQAQPGAVATAAAAAAAMELDPIDNAGAAASTTTGTGARKKRPRDLWEHRFQELMTFRSQYGHCNVPQHYKDNRALAYWVTHIRDCMLDKKRGKSKPSLSQERIAKLNSVGFVWNMFDQRWKENYHSLKKYHQQHGHSNVPDNYRDKTLVRFVHKQRDEYELYQNEATRSSRKCRLTPERIDLLNQLDMNWFGNNEDAAAVAVAAAGVDPTSESTVHV